MCGIRCLENGSIWTQRIEDEKAKKGLVWLNRNAAQVLFCLVYCILQLWTAYVRIVQCPEQHVYNFCRWSAISSSSSTITTICTARIHCRRAGSMLHVDGIEPNTYKDKLVHMHPAYVLSFTRKHTWKRLCLVISTPLCYMHLNAHSLPLNTLWVEREKKVHFPMESSREIHPDADVRALAWLPVLIFNKPLFYWGKLMISQQVKSTEMGRLRDERLANWKWSFSKSQSSLSVLFDKVESAVRVVISTHVKFSGNHIGCMMRTLHSTEQVKRECNRKPDYSENKLSDAQHIRN